MPRKVSTYNTTCILDEATHRRLSWVEIDKPLMPRPRKKMKGKERRGECHRISRTRLDTVNMIIQVNYRRKRRLLGAVTRGIYMKAVADTTSSEYLSE
jgi:hypothetical protein